MKKILLVILFVAMLAGGTFFVQQTAFAQALGGKILMYHFPNIFDPFQLRHQIGPPVPSVMPVLCAICMGPLGVGRWFLGFSVGGIVTIGGLGGF